jgi:formate dehydrogenase iron-sulfur subunit
MSDAREKRTTMQLNRRNFIKFSTVGAGGLALLSTLKSESVSGASRPINQTAKAMLNDTSKCVGCRACQSACKRWNSLPAESLGYDALYDNPSDLSAKTWTVIKAKEFQANGSKELLLAKYQCMHCAEASCVEVCPTKALYHHYFGFVAYDKEKCSGCGYCTQTCPFQIPHLSGSTLTGFEKMDKCTFCQDRVAYGQMPGEEQGQ